MFFLFVQLFKIRHPSPFRNVWMRVFARIIMIRLVQKLFLISRRILFLYLLFILLILCCGGRNLHHFSFTSSYHFRLTCVLTLSIIIIIIIGITIWTILIILEFCEKTFNLFFLLNQRLDLVFLLLAPTLISFLEIPLFLF
jgi:hypothetical protein